MQMTILKLERCKDVVKKCFRRAENTVRKMCVLRGQLSVKVVGFIFFWIKSTDDRFFSLDVFNTHEWFHSVWPQRSYDGNDIYYNVCMQQEGKADVHQAQFL